MAMRVVVVSSVMSWSLRSRWDVEAGGHTVLAPADKDGFAADQCLRDLGATALENAADGLARDAHGLRRLLVAQPLEIDEADRLQLVHRELQMLELPRWIPAGLNSVTRGTPATARSMGGRGTAYPSAHRRR